MARLRPGGPLIARYEGADVVVAVPGPGQTSAILRQRPGNRLDPPAPDVVEAPVRGVDGTVRPDRRLPVVGRGGVGAVVAEQRARPGRAAVLGGSPGAEVNRGARRAALATAAVAGMAAGVAVTLSFADADDAARATSTSVTTTTTTTSAPPSTTTSTVPVDAPEVLLVWTSGGLPAGLADQVRSLDGVDEVALVHGDETAMSASFDDAGEPVDVLADGWRIPLDTIAVEPASFSSFLDGPAAAAVESLQPGDALLTETSAKLRHDLGAGVHDPPRGWHRADRGDHR